MAKKTKLGAIICYGSAVVGERGQIVLPAKLRADLKIKKGEIFVVVNGPLGIALVNSSLMDNVFTNMLAPHLKSMQVSKKQVKKI